MPRVWVPNPPEFRRQMVGLARSGRTPQDLAREFEPNAQSVVHWVRQAERDGRARLGSGDGRVAISVQDIAEAAQPGRIDSLL